MSPTVFREGPLRFFFFSREEPRAHVHVVGAEGEAKVWLEPGIELARSHGFDARTVRRILETTERRRGEIEHAWRRHFAS